MVVVLGGEQAVKRTPVVFLHGLWLNTSSWMAWAELFDSRGFLSVVLGWPDGPADGSGTRQEFDEVGLDLLIDHCAAAVAALGTAPVIVGHSVGGLVAQHLVTAGVGRAGVAIAPVPVDGVPLPDVTTGLPPTPAGGTAGRAPTMSHERFRTHVANTVGARESQFLYERHVMAAPRRLLADLAGAGGTRRGRRAVADVGNACRGPLLLISGQEDRIVPDAATRAVYKQYGDTTAVTDLKQFPDRAHSLVVDSGWRAVADHVLDWLAAQGVHATVPDDAPPARSPAGFAGQPAQSVAQGGP